MILVILVLFINSFFSYKITGDWFYFAIPVITFVLVFGTNIMIEVFGL